MSNIGFIGAGNVTNIILSFNNLKFLKNIVLYDKNAEKVEDLINKFNKKYKIRICNSLQEILKVSDVIVEAASIEAVDEIFQILNLDKKFKTKKFIILSVGGVLKNFKLYKKLISLGYKIYIPSGAIAGCDALSAVKFSDIKHIELTTIKPTNTLITSDYILKNQKLYRKLFKSKKCVVYEGDVYGAIKFFPQNINVAATLAVVSEVPQKIKVKIIADSKIKRNIHEIKISSSVGEIFVKVENVPSPNNPKTSYLAALSALATIKEISVFRNF
ncbi:MAG: DUF108 domain-containing protein [Elusimicrobiota bacterium]|nr:DUF108 domain-containing protein [Endomicrobiia bacterium]MCX7910353.1 DUF108 domain-containing protein [Endomicrobiia bacterium]MDW8165551.1 DUF108 domain-containing protein [Elusimicrobiota bacterium]